MTPEIRKFPDEELLTPCKDVTVFDDSLKRLCSKMFQVMIDHHGIGLAANQIGVLERILVINIPKDAANYEGGRDYHDKRLVFINPIFTFIGDRRSSMQEGCLSFPNVLASVLRPESVRVEAQDVHGEKFVTIADGMLARCLQHEIDHLNGVTMIHRAIGEN